MRTVGKIGWLECALVGVLFPVGMYLVFDRMFLIPLPTGLSVITSSFHSDIGGRTTW